MVFEQSVARLTLALQGANDFFNFVLARKKNDDQYENSSLAVMLTTRSVVEQQSLAVPTVLLFYYAFMAKYYHNNSLEDTIQKLESKLHMERTQVLDVFPLIYAKWIQQGVVPKIELSSLYELSWFPHLAIGSVFCTLPVEELTRFQQFVQKQTLKPQFSPSIQSIVISDTNAFAWWMGNVLLAALSMLRILEQDIMMLACNHAIDIFQVIEALASNNMSATVAVTSTDMTHMLRRHIVETQTETVFAVGKLLSIAPIFQLAPTVALEIELKASDARPDKASPSIEERLHALVDIMLLISKQLVGVTALQDQHDLQKRMDALVDELAEIKTESAASGIEIQSMVALTEAELRQLRLMVQATSTYDRERYALSVRTVFQFASKLKDIISGAAGATELAEKVRVETSELQSLDYHMQVVYGHGSYFLGDDFNPLSKTDSDAIMQEADQRIADDTSKIASPQDILARQKVVATSLKRARLEFGKDDSMEQHAKLRRLQEEVFLETVDLISVLQTNCTSVLSVIQNSIGDRLRVIASRYAVPIPIRYLNNDVMSTRSKFRSELNFIIKKTIHNVFQLRNMIILWSGAEPFSPVATNELYSVYRDRSKVFFTDERIMRLFDTETPESLVVYVTNLDKMLLTIVHAMDALDQHRDTISDAEREAAWSNFQNRNTSIKFSEADPRIKLRTANPRVIGALFYENLVALDRIEMTVDQQWDAISAFMRNVENKPLNPRYSGLVSRLLSGIVSLPSVMGVGLSMIMPDGVSPVVAPIVISVVLPVVNHLYRKWNRSRIEKKMLSILVHEYTTFVYEGLSQLRDGHSVPFEVFRRFDENTKNIKLPTSSETINYKAMVLHISLSLLFHYMASGSNDSAVREVQEHLKQPLDQAYAKIRETSIGQLAEKLGHANMTVGSVADRAVSESPFNMAATALSAHLGQQLSPVDTSMAAVEAVQQIAAEGAHLPSTTSLLTGFSLTGAFTYACSLVAGAGYAAIGNRVGRMVKPSFVHIAELSIGDDLEAELVELIAEDVVYEGEWSVLSRDYPFESALSREARRYAISVLRRGLTLSFEEHEALAALAIENGRYDDFVKLSLLCIR